MKPLSLSATRTLRSHHDMRTRQPQLRLPRTDYTYQTAVEEVRTARPPQSAAKTRARAHAFREMTQSYPREKSGALLELSTYALVAGLVVYSLVSLVILLAQTARG